MAGAITYPRNTTFTLGGTYSNSNNVAGVTAMFTVKPSPGYDSDSSDTTNSILKKDASITGGAYTIVINPTDIADTVAPGKYVYDIKVLDSSGAIYQAVSPSPFILTAGPTNRET